MIKRNKALTADIISVKNILPYLEQKEIANNIFVYDSLESTNNTAKTIAAAGAEHGTIIVADSQTAGRGRYNKKFFSPPRHGIYISFILRQPMQTGTLATLYTAVAVCEAIELLTEFIPEIKWVNDIYLNGKKICGILTESLAQQIIVGIGINFSTPPECFPVEIKETAGSIFSNSTPVITRSQLIAEIANKILTENQYDEQTILLNYKKRLMLLRKKISITGSNGTCTVTAIDIDDTGRLIMQKTNGEIFCISAGEIQFNNIQEEILCRTAANL